MRHRFMFRFWLDINKSDERELAEQMENLKRKRQFSRTIRDALRLFLDLKEGRTDVLRELFPGIGLTPAMDFEAIIQQAADASADKAQRALLGKVADAAPPATLRGDDPSALPMSAQPELPEIDAPLLASGNLSGLKPDKSLPDPQEHDDLADLLEVKEVADQGGQAARNFINSMLALQGSAAKTK